MNRCIRLNRRLIAGLLAWYPGIIFLPTLSSGCVALNIPSVRYDDPDDQGGLLGPHRQAAGGGNRSGSVPLSADCESSSEFLAGDDGLAVSDAPKPPEVPWPRFHPLPTRPVFSTLQP